MKIKIGTLYTFTLLIFSNFIYSQHTDMINSNRPGMSQAAFSVGKTVFQVETGLYGIRENHDLQRYESTGFGLDLHLRYGAFLEQLEFIAESQFQSDQYTTPLTEENRTGIRNLLFGAKYLIYDPWKNYEEKPNLYSWKANHKFKWRQFIPAVAVYAGANFSIDDTFLFPNEPTISPKVMVIAQNHFGTQWVMVTNIYMNKIGTDFSSIGYVLTITRGINDKWSAFIENQGIKSDLYADSIFRGGAAYLLKNNFQIDASISSSIKDTPSILYGGFGMSWRFDKNYKPIKIESGKEEKKSKQQKKKDKEKEKVKKRLDQVEG